MTDLPALMKYGPWAPIAVAIVTIGQMGMAGLLGPSDVVIATVGLTLAAAFLGAGVQFVALMREERAQFTVLIREARAQFAEMMQEERSQHQARITMIVERQDSSREINERGFVATREAILGLASNVIKLEQSLGVIQRLDQMIQRGERRGRGVRQ